MYFRSKYSDKEHSATVPHLKSLVDTRSNRCFLPDSDARQELLVQVGELTIAAPRIEVPRT